MMDGRTSSKRVARDDVLHRVGNTLRGASEALNHARDTVAKTQKIHPTDLRCLAYLDDMGTPVSPKAIISALGLTSGSGTALLDRLETDGYVARIPNPNDRRSVLVQLDRARAASLLQHFRSIENAFLAITEQMTEHELETIADFLGQIEAVCKSLPQS